MNFDVNVYIALFSEQWENLGTDCKEMAIRWYQKLFIQKRAELIICKPPII